MNKIANVENVVCSVETMSQHPELYHYTKPAAFEGIVGTQTLWCSLSTCSIDARPMIVCRRKPTAVSKAARLTSDPLDSLRHPRRRVLDIAPWKRDGMQ